MSYEEAISTTNRQMRSTRLVLKVQINEHLNSNKRTCALIQW